MKFIFFLLFLTFSSILFCQPKTFIREYTYHGGEVDSKVTARTNALSQVKKILLEEVGVFVHSETTTGKKENSVSDDYINKVQSITAGITETKILEERGNAEEFYIKASITVDPSEIKGRIDELMNDKKKVEELVAVKKRADDASLEIEKLKKELALAKSENEKLAKRKEYVEASNTLSAADWFQKGYNAYFSKVVDYDQAIFYFEKVIELEPNNIEALGYLAHFYFMKDNEAKALWCEERIIEINPLMKNKVYSGLGMHYDIVRNYDKSIYYYEKAIQNGLNDWMTYYNMGVMYSKNNNADKALKCYEKSIELEPKNSDAYVGIGTIYKEKGNLDKTIEFFELAVKSSPNDYYSYGFLAEAYGEKGNLDKAIQLLEKASELNPGYSDGFVDLGRFYHERDFEKALLLYRLGAKHGNKDIQKWLKDNNFDLEPKPSGANDFYQKGYDAFGLKDYNSAIQYFQQAIKLDSKNPIFYFSIAMAYFNSENIDKSIEMYEKTIEVDPNYINAYYNVAVSYFKKGNSEKGIQNLQKAAKLGMIDAQKYLKENGYSW